MSRGAGKVMVLVLDDIGIVPHKKISKLIFKARGGTAREVRNAPTRVVGDEKS
jgi:hypothetical protein